MKEELKVGQVFKNYKAICEWLGVKPASGNTKISHMKEFDRYCKYHKDGNKFIIDEIYDVPMDKVDKRENNGSDGNSKYYDDIEKVLLYLLQKENKQTIICSVGKALEIVNMINKNYRVARENIKLSSEILGVNETSMFNMFNKYHKGLCDIFENALTKMANQSLIYYSNCIMVSKKEVVPKLNKLGEIALDSDNNPIVRMSETHYIATDNELALILKAEEKVLDDLGFKTKQQVVLSGAWNSFSEKVNKILSLDGNINYYYDAYKIICNESGLKKKIKIYQYDESRFSLNDKMIDKLKLSIEKKESNGWYPEEVRDTYKLVDDLIDIDTSIDLRVEINKTKKPKKVVQNQTPYYN